MNKELYDIQRINDIADGIPRYSFSKIRHFHSCPKKMDLSFQHETELTVTQERLYAEGRAFEAMVFYDKNNELESAMKKKSFKDTIEPLANSVKARNIFLSDDIKRDSFIRFGYRDPRGFTLSGEIDYMGDLDISCNYTGVELKGRYIADLKYTKDLVQIWRPAKSKWDVLQVVFYSYINWKYINPGEVLDGVYVVCENKIPEDPSIMARYVSISEDSYAFLEQLILDVHYDTARLPYPSFKNCLGFGVIGQGRCPYFKHCTQGRELIESMQHVEFDSLTDK